MPRLEYIGNNILSTLVTPFFIYQRTILSSRHYIRSAKIVNPATKNILLYYLIMVCRSNAVRTYLKKSKLVLSVIICIEKVFSHCELFIRVSMFVYIYNI